MSNVRQILVSAIGLAALGVGLAGCGQRGPLYLPTDPAAANRATLPQVLLPIPTRGETSTVYPSQGEPSPSSNDKTPGSNGNSTNNSNPTGTAK